MTYKIRNKWVVVFGALSAQIAIGAMYAWSLFNEPISEAFGWNYDDVVLTYSISLLSFSLSTILSGKLQLSKGPRTTALIGGLLYSSGILLSSFATSPYMLYITYGVMAGSGVGFVYVCPLSTLVKWFPNRKGLVTGVATAAFAMGGFVFKQIIGDMLHVENYTPELISATFLTVGVIYLVMTVGGSLLLDTPEKDLCVTNEKCAPEQKNYNRGEMVKTANFYKLLFSDLLALMPGLLIIGMAKDIGTQFVGLNYETAAGVVGLIAIFNAAGRLASGSLADKLGALNIYRFMYVVTILSLGILCFIDLNYPLFVIAIVGIVLGYGSFLSLVPTMVGKIFGGKYFSANYSLIFQAYGFAALIGPTIKRNAGGFHQTFIIAMSAAILGLLISMFIKPTMEEEVVPELAKELA